MTALPIERDNTGQQVVQAGSHSIGLSQGPDGLEVRLRGEPFRSLLPPADAQQVLMLLIWATGESLAEANDTALRMVQALAPGAQLAAVVFPVDPPPTSALSDAELAALGPPVAPTPTEPAQIPAEQVHTLEERTRLLELQLLHLERRTASALEEASALAHRALAAVTGGSGE